MKYTSDNEKIQAIRKRALTEIKAIKEGTLTEEKKRLEVKRILMELEMRILGIKISRMKFNFYRKNPAKFNFDNISLN